MKHKLLIFSPLLMTIFSPPPVLAGDVKAEEAVVDEQTMQASLRDSYPGDVKAEEAIVDEQEPGGAKAERRAYPLVLASLQEATALPGSMLPFRGPRHPGLTVGSEYEYTRGAWGRIFQAASVGFYHHADLDMVLSLTSEFGYGYSFDFGLGLEALVGLGYGHSFNALPTYSLETRNQTMDGGQPSIIGSAALGVQYDFRAYDLLPATLFVRYQPQLQIMLASDSPLGALPRTSLWLGTKIFFN